MVFFGENATLANKKGLSKGFSLSLLFSGERKN